MAISRRRLLFFATFLGALGTAGALPAADEVYAPHTPTLIFHLTGQTDADAIRASVQKLASVQKIVFDQGTVRVRFDSHVVSYHQVAQAIGGKYDPALKVIVPEYAQPGNAAKVDAVFAGKRLNQRVRVEPLDKTKGEFLVHFLPLTLDAAESGPQGFNGGHLHHPVSDPPPRGLGLRLDYESADNGAR